MPTPQAYNYFGGVTASSGNNGLSLNYGGSGSAKKQRAKESEYDYAIATNPTKAQAELSDYGLTIRTNPKREAAKASGYDYEVATNPKKALAANAEADMVIATAPSRTTALQGQYRNQAYDQDNQYAESTVASGMAQLARDIKIRLAEKTLASVMDGSFEQKQKASGVTYKNGFDAAGMTNYLQQIVAANKAGMANNPYQYNSSAAVPYQSDYLSARAVKGKR